MPTSEYGSGTDSVPHGTTRHSTTRQGSGDFTSLVTNPPTSDNGVTSLKLTREEPCRCMSSWAYVSPMHDGHCCFHPANQKCHPDAFAVWERELHRLRFERTSVPSMNGGSRVVSSASPSTGDQQ